MRGTASGKKSSGSQPKNLDPALPGRWGSLCGEHPFWFCVEDKDKQAEDSWQRRQLAVPEAPQPSLEEKGTGRPTVESEEAFKSRMEVKVKIPEELKPRLVDDWDLVTGQKQLFQLPAKKNVDAILEECANCRKSQGNVDNKEYAVNEVVGGIKEYFNVMLGTQLLYKFERPQYAEILLAHPDAPMSQICGAPHLLRIFVRIGAVLAYMRLDEKSLALLLGYLHDFLKYLAKNSACLLSAITK